MLFNAIIFNIMARTKKGKKFIRIAEAIRVNSDGSKSRVKAHIRSTPCPNCGCGHRKQSQTSKK